MIMARNKHDKKMEFSKRLAVWAIVTASISVILSYILAWAERDSVSDMSLGIFTACIGYLIAYAAKSGFEKNSRNKYGRDEYGNPFYQDDEPEAPLG